MYASLELITSLSEHRGCINSIKFDSSGVYCMTAGNDRTIRLWNPAKKLHIKKFFGPHNYEVNDIALSEDNKNFVSVGAEHSAFVWDTIEAKIIRKHNHGGKVTCCNYTSNGLLCTGSEDKMVRIWDNRARNPIQTFPEATDSITSVVETSAVIISSSVDGNVRQYDLRKGILKTDAFSHPITSLSISTAISDCYIISILDDSIKLVECGVVLQEYVGHSYNNYRIKCTFDPSERFVISGCSSGDLYYWSIELGNQYYKLYQGAHKGVITCTAFSNPQLLSTSGKLKHDIEKNVKDLILDKNTIFATAGRDGILNVWHFKYSK